MMRRVGRALLACLAVAACAAPCASATAPSTPPAVIGQLGVTDGGQGIVTAASGGGDVFGLAPEAMIGPGEGTGAVFVFATGPGGSGTVHPVATLTTGVLGHSLGYGSNSIFATGDQVVVMGDGGFYVFTEPTGGWSGIVHPSAVLHASDGNTFHEAVAQGGTIVAASEGSAHGVGALFVFTQPAGGWSGAVTESAVLVPAVTGQTYGFSLGISTAISASGRTIAADFPGITAPGAGPGAVFVFTEPAGGWSGPQTQTAELVAPNRGPLVTEGSVIAASDDTVAVWGSTTSAYVFGEPAGGWSGLQSTAATLTNAAGLDPPDAVLGDDVFAGYLVYAKPAAGWTGSPAPVATLHGAAGPIYAASGQVLVSGNLATTDDGAIGTFGGTAVVFTEPAAGWAGTVDPTATLSPTTAQTPNYPITSAPQASIELFVKPSSGWVDGPQTMTLAPTGNPRAAQFSTIAATDGTVVAYDGSPAGPAVFTEPPGGWTSTSAAARLTPGPGWPTGRTDVGGLAVSDDTVATVVPGGIAVDLYSRPAPGWSGSVAASGALITGDPRARFIPHVAFSGATLLAGTEPSATYDPPLDQFRALLFTEPRSGWAGAIGPSGSLTANGLGTLDPNISALAGSTAVVAGQAGQRPVVFVFSQPPGGWAGTLLPSAMIPLPENDGIDGLELTDGAILVDAVGAVPPFGVARPTLDVFRPGPDGWLRVHTPSLRLQPVSGFAAAGATAFGTVAAPYPGKTCPCSTLVRSFTLTPGGSGQTIVGGPPLIVSSLSSLFTLAAADGTAFLATGDTNVRIIRPGVGSGYGDPTLTSATITGLSGGRPALTVRVTAATSARAFKRLAITLPPGLSLVTRPGPILLAGRRVRSFHLAGSALIVRPVHVTSFRLVLPAGALRETPALRRASSRRLTIQLDLLDTSGNTFALHGELRTQR